MCKIYEQNLSLCDLMNLIKCMEQNILHCIKSWDPGSALFAYDLSSNALG